MSQHNEMGNPWLALGLCPSAEMLKRPELLEELIESAAKIMKKHLHPDKIHGDSNLFLQAQEAHDALGDTLTRHARARELHEFIGQGDLLKAENDGHRKLAVKAALEASLWKKNMEQADETRKKDGETIERQRKDIAKMADDLTASRAEIERTRTEAVAALERQREDITKKWETIEAERGKINEQIGALRETMLKSQEMLSTAGRELSTALRGRRDAEEALRYFRNSLKDETLKLTPYLIACMGILTALAGGAAGIVYSRPGGNVFAFVFAALGVLVMILSFLKAGDMMRRLNVVTWKTPAVKGRPEMAEILAISASSSTSQEEKPKGGNI